jgi:hypothetical protein|tara:strand:- start:505 stop:1629 length:1125 start_codon:yes stop_codon:yes gene_type:complete
MAGAEFDKIFNWDGVGTSSGDYTDVTLEAQSPAGTSFTLFDSSAHYLYLGHASKFDMAVFDVDIAGSLGALTWQYRKSDDTWVTFVPGSARYEVDPDDDEGGQYDFSKDGAELFPPNILSDWATLTINSSNLYWVRVTAASVATSPTIKRIQMRPYAAYCTTKDVYELLQLANVLSGTDFTTSTIPTQNTVERFIMESQSYIDMYTRKSWRPTFVANEYQQFNLNGFKLDKPDAYKVLSVKIWNGASWDTKTQGRKNDYFLVQDTGMVQFSRYFLLPARFTSYNAPVWRWGGGEFTMPIKVTYLAGRDINTDVRQGGIIQDSSKKLAAISIMRSSDAGTLTVSGVDRVSMESRVAAWQEEVNDNLDRMGAFEVF